MHLSYSLPGSQPGLQLGSRRGQDLGPPRRRGLATIVAMAIAVSTPLFAQPSLPRAARDTAISTLLADHGAAHEVAIRRGVGQAADRWWAEDGDEAAFVAFCREQFNPDPAAREALFARLQVTMEQIDGHLHEVRRLLAEPLELERLEVNGGVIAPLDRLLSEVNLQAHVDNELYRSKAAFAALLHFPVRTLDEVLAESGGWDRRTWAETRMMDRFANRVPPAVGQRIASAFNAADAYVADYYVRMDRLRTDDGRQIFPEGLRLITHWNLRDELAAHYGGGAEGLEKQRMIAEVMRRIVRQEIPQVAIDNELVTWNPWSNVVSPRPEATMPAGTDLTAREMDRRYGQLLAVFHAVREADAFDPQAPSFVRRRFERDRQMPEAEVRALLESVLASPEARELAGRIQQRLGRPLEPFDIWYSGFKSRGTRSEAELDAATKARYPNVAAFQADLPRILRGLGFAAERADWLASRIVVDPSRGAGHAMGAVRREDRAHLRTRIGAGGMDYKGYNIAVHELGHNVEQVFSLEKNDFWWLSGVPNNAFTEALAFVFQERDLELLGLAEADARESSGESSAKSSAKGSAKGSDTRHDQALATLWATFEIGGVGLVDMDVWNWMYAHPNATPAELREATLAIARDVWNRFYAPLFGVADSEILAIYSHMIVYGLYLPDYPLGHIIAFQVAERLKHAATTSPTGFGEAFEAVSRQGRLTPDAWMRGATGDPVSTAALLAAAREALAATR